MKQFQAWLMKNQINQGVQVKQVKANVENNVKLGLSFQEIVASGNIEAMKELTTFAMNACAEVARNKQLEAEKKENSLCLITRMRRKSIRKTRN